MKFGVIVAARTGSARLPGKALLPLKGLPMISFLLKRIQGSKEAENIVFATTDLAEDDRLAAVAGTEKVPVFRGANNDVVRRYVECAAKFGMEYVVRVTGDCPFADAETLDYCLRRCQEWGEFDLASTKTAFPVGVDYEIYKAATMERLDQSGDLSVTDREHLTKYLYDHPKDFRLRVIPPEPGWKWQGRPFTVDTEEDYRFAQKIVEGFSDSFFSVRDLLERAMDVVQAKD